MSIGKRKLGRKNENPKTAKAEAIMICLDTSSWMENTKSAMFKDQAAAIHFYCKKKLESNPRTIVGLCGTADFNLGSFRIHPTRDLDTIMCYLDDVKIGGYMRLSSAVYSGHSLLLDSLGTDMQKRIVIFAGGPLHEPLVEEAGLLGTEMKDQDVACDVISFGDPYMNKRQFFNKLVRSTDKEGNCNICHVPPESSLLEALSRSQILIPRVGGGSGSAQSSSLSGQHDKAIVVYVKALPSYAHAPPRNPNDRKTDCPFCQRVLLTLEEKEVPYTIQFMRKKPKWFFKVNPDGNLPLIRFSDGTFVSNSDVIVGMIEEMHPKHPLVARPYFASLGLKILPKLSEFLKSKDKNSEQALLYELMELEGHLLDYGPFASGKEIKAVDLSLAPKLYHLVNASCELTIPEDLTNVQRYIEILFNHPSFEKTKPSPEDVKEGWRQRLRMREVNAWLRYQLY